VKKRIGKVAVLIPWIGAATAGVWMWPLAIWLLLAGQSFPGMTWHAFWTSWAMVGGLVEALMLIVLWLYRDWFWQAWKS